ncbi:redox-sensitive transcriptional activator SoxR [Francisella sp. 19X1-34]|uniref:redox-sensitive transcriptional activator SoxR n=1 Tax=Francisella sp. 19X1-34 TaxID=3087177 RepID=UPI002E32DFAA|nr:redox-sensitive transcriptional activator SoxR [Francisella sp. 19X1-34]MED7788912.1 redox-sensitive transcriptional activator SoxR [Francisella sp. 19X1-34]
MNNNILSVGQVANRCDVKISTIHFYERKGLITSWRNSGNQRRYNRDVLRKISIIKAAQKVGISLEEIKKAFAKLPNRHTPNETDWQKLSNNWRNDLDNRIDYLIKLRDNLSKCIGCGCLSLKACPLYNKDDKLGKTVKGAYIFSNIAK